MKKILSSLIVCLFLIVGTVSYAGEYYETGDLTHEGTVVHNQTEEEMNAALQDAGCDDLATMYEKLSGMTTEEQQEYLKEQSEKYSEATGTKVEMVWNFDGDAVSSNPGETKEITDIDTDIEDAKNKYVASLGNGHEQFLGIYDLAADPETGEEHKHERYVHNCTGGGWITGGTKAESYSLPFTSSIYPNNSQENLWGIGSSFTLAGNRHVFRYGTNPGYDIDEIECGGIDRDVCLAGICETDESAPCQYKYTVEDYGTPHYTDTVYGVRVEFEGFVVDAGFLSEDTIVSADSDSYDGTRYATAGAFYGKGYKVTDLIESQLKKHDSGLLEGKVKVICSCGETKTHFVYFGDIPQGHTLTLKADGGGKVAINEGDLSEEDSGWFMENSFVPIKAVADPGCKFDGWYVWDNAYIRGDDEWFEKKERKFRDEEFASTTIPMFGQDCTLIARFVPEDMCRVNVIVADGHGRVKVDEQIGETLFLEVPSGGSLQIDTIHNEYEDNEFQYIRCEEYIGDIWKAVPVTGDSIILNNIDRDYTLFIYFEYNNTKKLTLLVGSAGGGSVGVYNNGEYNLGEYIEIDAIPGEMYDIYAFPDEEFWFDVWKKDSVIPTDYGQYDVIIMPSEDLTLEANFTDISMFPSVMVETMGGGSVAIGDNENFYLWDQATVNDNTDVTIKAMPSEGFEFDYWYNLCEPYDTIYMDDCYEVDGVYMYDVNVTQNAHYLAYFKTEYGFPLTVTVNNEEWGWARDSVDFAVPGEDYRVEAYPYENAEFLYWMDYTGKILSYNTRHWVTMEESPYTVIACFESNIIPNYTLTIIEEGPGSTTGSGSYPEGTAVTVTADPAGSYQFAGWYDENNRLLSTSESYEVYMYCDRTLTAKFTQNVDVSSFKVVSIRDLRWQDYFVRDGVELNNALTIPANANANTILVEDAHLTNNNSRDRSVVFGYAVECELTTIDIDCDVENLTDEDNTGIKIDVNVPGVSLPNKFKSITSKDANDIKDFMITATKSSKTIIVDGVEIERPIITWRWVYYLPIDLDIPEGMDELTVGFSIKVLMPDESNYYDYIKALKITDNNSWGGKLFNYRTDKTVLDDIYDDAIN